MWSADHPESENGKRRHAEPTGIWRRHFVPVVAAMLAMAGLIARGATSPGLVALHATASSSQPGFAPSGAIDGDRFSALTGQAWKGVPGATSSFWEVDLGRIQPVRVIRQVLGEHAFVFTNAPVSYVWQTSRDGRTWSDLTTTRTRAEQRLFREHRLPRTEPCRFLRLNIMAISGCYPVLREVEFLTRSRDAPPFDPWILVVNTTHDPTLPGHGQEFIPLAKSCPGWTNLAAQQVWIGDFNASFVGAEPRPLCAFLSGNFKDWCEIDRRWWRGVQTVLHRGDLPMWASCGGAQGLALISEYGVDRPWDCPHCRDPRHPKTPLYTHIGHTAARPCGDYSACAFERGPTNVRQVGRDPVFAGLPDEFLVMESHCGQIAWPPRGWELVATAGAGAKTRVQCLRLKHRPIYAAQFHIEMAGTPEVSKTIMANFLELARPKGSVPTNVHSDRR